MVLTGPEKARLITGFELLLAGAAPSLLISGAGDPAGYLDAYRPPGVCCYAIDHARDTIENASFTALWVAQNQVKVLILVTSDYHMQRALWLLRRSLPPSVTAYPFPVSSTRALLPRRIVVEYHRLVGQSMLAAVGLI